MPQKRNILNDASVTEHWDRIYEAKGDRETSWFEGKPATSLDLITACGVNASTHIIDIGAGNSRLVDWLLSLTVGELTVLDASAVALAAAQARLGEAAASVEWIHANVTGEWTTPPVDIWHDRAVFHFLTTADEREAYRERLREKMKVGGHVIIATFALEGPEKCSGLPVMRYSPETLAAELGSGFELIESRSHTHRTPWGAAQEFQYSRFRRL